MQLRRLAPVRDIVWEWCLVSMAYYLFITLCMLVPCYEALLVPCAPSFPRPGILLVSCAPSFSGPGDQVVSFAPSFCGPGGSLVTCAESFCGSGGPLVSSRHGIHRVEIR